MKVKIFSYNNQCMMNSKVFLERKNKSQIINKLVLILDTFLHIAFYYHYYFNTRNAEWQPKLYFNI